MITSNPNAMAERRAAYLNDLNAKRAKREENAKRRVEAREALKDPNNLIAVAVMPQKKKAQDRAEQFAKERVAFVKSELEKNGWDINAAAPRPRSMGMGRVQYMAAAAKRYMFASVVKSRVSYLSMNAPDFVDMNKERIAKFIADARKSAAEEYDMFVMKLNGKIGAVKSAKLEGDHVWGFSFLTVQPKDKGRKEEIWKTQMILNVSKLGKAFNQFPTRKVNKKEGRK